MEDYSMGRKIAGKRRATVRFAMGVMAAALALVMIGVPVSAQQAGQPPPDRQIDAAMQKEIIDSVTAALDEVYVFPDKATEMGKFVRKQYKDGKYKKLTSCNEFTQKLSEDLVSVCHDRHLGMRYFPDEMIARMAGDTMTTRAREDELAADRRANFGFREVKLLPGNIGYIDLRGFFDAANAGGTAIAAMNFLQYTDAIIFDLRKNGGGSPSMIQLISSYLFDEPQHLNSFYIRKEDTVKQFWTQAFVEGRKMLDADVYILTSSQTFSAAEEFTYNLKNMERATVIGETTGGGAHPVDLRIFANLNVGMRLPFGRAINPITGTNWEGTGVAPDIEVPASEAYDRAYMEALKKIEERTEDEDRKFQVAWALESIKAKMKPAEVDEATLRRYVGSYGPRTLRYEDGHLVYQREEREPMVMVPMNDHLFMFDELDFFRLEVQCDNDGHPIALVGHYDNGRQDRSPRDGMN